MKATIKIQSHVRRHKANMATKTRRLAHARGLDADRGDSPTNENAHSPKIKQQATTDRSRRKNRGNEKASLPPPDRNGSKRAPSTVDPQAFGLDGDFLEPHAPMERRKSLTGHGPKPMKLKMQTTPEAKSPKVQRKTGQGADVKLSN